MEAFGARHSVVESHPLDFTCGGSEPYHDPFSMGKFHAALDTCGDIVPDAEDIPYAMLRHLAERSMTFLFGLI